MAEVDRLTRDGRILRREDGSIWNWRGASMFLLPARWRAGEDIRPQIDWMRAIGVTVARVFPDWTLDKSNRGLTGVGWIAEFLDQMQDDHGIRCEVVAITEYDRPLSERRHIVAILDEILSERQFHFLQVENEPWNRGDDPRLALDGHSPRALTCYGICPVNGPALSTSFVSQPTRKVDPALTGTVDEGLAYLQAESLRCRGYQITDEEKRLAGDFIRERFPGWDETQPGTGEMVNLLLAEMDKRLPSLTPSGPMNYADCVRRDYLTTHLPRDLAHYFRNGKELYEMWGMQTFLVDDEPLGVADYDKTGSGARSTDRKAHVWHHTISRLFGGSTIHSQFGLEGRAPGEDEPISRRICEDLAAMWAAIPDHAYTGRYSRAGLADFPLDVRAEDAPDDSHPGTGYASLHGDTAYVVVPKATEQFMGDVDRRLVNGWRTVEVIGPPDCAIYRVSR